MRRRGARTPIGASRIFLIFCFTEYSGLSWKQAIKRRECWGSLQPYYWLLIDVLHGPMIFSIFPLFISSSWQKSEGKYFFVSMECFRSNKNFAKTTVLPYKAVSRSHWKLHRWSVNWSPSFYDWEILWKYPSSSRKNWPQSETRKDLFRMPLSLQIQQPWSTNLRHFFMRTCISLNWQLPKWNTKHFVCWVLQ